MQSYLDKRDQEIDTYEWIDIYRALLAIGARHNNTIVELCAGKGYLLEWLERTKLPLNEYIGVDLEGCKYNPRIKCMDLNKEDPPKGDIYISQHCLEHLNQDRVIELLRTSLENGIASIHIVPGHYVNDPTHVVNHYHYEDLEQIIEKLNPKYYVIVPDSVSYTNPRVLDYLMILSNVPINKKKLLPLTMRLSLLFAKIALRLERKRMNAYLRGTR